MLEAGRIGSDVPDLPSCSVPTIRHAGCPVQASFPVELRAGNRFKVDGLHSLSMEAGGAMLGGVVYRRIYKLLCNS